MSSTNCRGTGAGYAATMRFVVIGSFGAALMLIGIALVYQAAGTLNLAQLAEVAPGTLDGTLGLAAFVFILVGAGVKAELFPVNTWVPEVYGAASRRVAGLLAGIISKLALLIILRLLVLVFQHAEALQVMLLLGMLGLITGEVALHHMVVKPALFLLAGRWGGALERLSGAAQASPLAAALFILLALSLIGIPPLPGFWAKFLVVSAALAQPGMAYVFAAAAILIAAVVEVSYLFRVVARLYRRLPAATLPPPPGRPELAVGSLLGGVLIATVLWLAPVGNGLRGIAAEAADRDAYIEAVNPARGLLP
jgi:formate hydrogenlyase subunit 3/multisubunit Na+/H+ antiporter MnhD subunit